MTTATLEKRVKMLEEEVKKLKRVTVGKKLPAGVLAGLRDAQAGRVYGPFSSGKQMRKAFEK